MAMTSRQIWSCKRCDKHMRIQIQNVNHELQKGNPERGNSGGTSVASIASPLARIPSLKTNLDDSFVILPRSPPNSSSLISPETLNSTLPSSSSTKSNNGDDNAVATAINDSTLDSQITALRRVFEIAQSKTLVEHPLCSDCVNRLEEELNAEIRQAEEDISAYQSCLDRWKNEGQGKSAEDSVSLHADLNREDELELQLLAELESIQNETVKVEEEMAIVCAQAERLSQMERKYWDDLNLFNFQLHAHQDYRDSILNKLEVGNAQLESLKQRNVLNDAFHIWFDGDFGTINGFRLGRLSKSPVEWEELNAGWGQACLLLYTMGQTCRITFTYRILPMGSYPRMADAKGYYDLFGPVNLFWSARYDKAMSLYLTCLDEFAQFAHSRDVSNGVPAKKCFQLPYKIEGDKVHSFCIRQAFNPDERWTKALKYMLCDLKHAAGWLVNSTPSS